MVDRYDEGFGGCAFWGSPLRCDLLVGHIRYDPWEGHILYDLCGGHMVSDPFGGHIFCDPCVFHMVIMISVGVICFIEICVIRGVVGNWWGSGVLCEVFGVLLCVETLVVRW